MLYQYIKSRKLDYAKISFSVVLFVFVFTMMVKLYLSGQFNYERLAGPQPNLFRYICAYL